MTSWLSPGAWGNWLYNQYQEITDPFGTKDITFGAPSKKDVPPEADEGIYFGGPHDVFSEADADAADQAAPTQPMPDYDEHADPIATANEEGYNEQEIEHLERASSDQGQTGIARLGAQVLNAVVGADVAYVSPVEDGRGVGARLLNTMAGLPGAGLIVGHSKTVRDGAAYAIIGSTDYHQVAKEQTAELRLIVGNPRLGLAIDAFVPKVTEIIAEKVLNTYPGFEAFVKKENGLIEVVVRSILLKVMANFARDTKLKLAELDPARSDLTTEILKELLRISNRQMNDLAAQGKFDEVDAIKVPDLKRQGFRNLFKPAALEFLAIALPHGKEDLELRGPLAEAIWNAMSKEVLPDMFVEIYRLEHKQPHHTAEDLEILEQRGGAALKHIAEFVGKEIGDVLPKVLAKESKEVAEGMLKNFGKEGQLWLRAWLGNRFKELVQSDDPEVKAIWGYAAKNIESIMIHAFAAIARQEAVGPEGNLIPAVAGKGLKVIDDFISANQEAIEAEFERYKGFPEKERKEALQKSFQPLVNEIIYMAGLEHNPMVKVVRESVLPSILCNIYEDMRAYNAAQAGEEKKLTDLLIDRVAHANQMLANPNPADIHRLALEGAEADVKKTVEELSKACGMLAEDVVQVAKEFAQKDDTKIAHLINKSLFKDNRLNEQEEQDLADGLRELMTAENPSMDKVWAYVQSLSQAAMFKVLVRVAENTPVDELDGRIENKNLALPGNVMHRVLSFLAEKIPAIDERINAIRNDENMTKAEKKAAMAELFRPLAKDFLDLAGPNLKEILPVPKMFKKFLAKKLEEDYLPALFSKMYKDLNGWRYEVPQEEARLDAIFPSGSGKNAATKIADYIRDFVPYYMETRPGMIGGIFEKVSGKYFNALSPEHQAQLRNLLVNNVRALGVNPDMKKTAEAIGEYSRAMILKMFAGVATTMQSKETAGAETGQNEFLFNTTLGFIKVLHDHVRRINRIPPSGRMFPAYQVPHAEMLNGFANHPELPNMLHPALSKDLDPKATAEERKEQRLKEFFVPFASDLLDIAGINNPEEFPAPSFMKQEAWDLFKAKVLPEVLMNVYEEALKPENLNLMMLKTIDALIEGIDGITEEEEAKVENDPQQRELNEALGNLVKEMVDLVPDIWTKTIFKSDRIRNMTSEALGRMIRRKLDDTTMLELLNKGLEGFSLNKPDADRGKTEKELKAERARIEKELTKKMTSYISRQVKDACKNMIKSKWDAFQAKFDRGIERAFGKPGLAVKRFLDKIFHFIFITLIGSALDFIVFKCLWFFVDLKIASKSKEIIKDVQMPIHENVVLNFTQTWLDAMKGRKPADLIEDQLIRENRRARHREEIAEEQRELHEDAVQAVIQDNQEEAAIDAADVQEDLQTDAQQQEAVNLDDIIAQQRAAAATAEMATARV